MLSRMIFEGVGEGIHSALTVSYVEAGSSGESSVLR